ncbi:unnamed protein product [Leptidea sinapis]|uniref:Kazal-like domain-containing protein n=1 Tax=Leptidea sinapis TaxID=189913 RepID=A0A5E4Q2T3_9NEOP|nr:unnamed protein product [Leptidea sinapis]
MLSWRVLLCVFVVAALHEAESSRLPLRPKIIGDENQVQKEGSNLRIQVEMIDARVREGVPLPLCAGRCNAPPAGPVCAFDATGTARTFATLCELEAVSCRESTHYAITSLGEC